MKTKSKSPPIELPQVGVTQLRRQFRKVAALVDQAGAVVITERGVPVVTMRRIHPA